MSEKSTLKAWAKASYSQNQAASAMNLSRGGFQSRLLKALKWARTTEGKKWCDDNGIDISRKSPKAPIAHGSVAPDVQIRALTEQIKTLQKALRDAQKTELSSKVIRSELLGLVEYKPEVPDWCNSRVNFQYSHGIPNLMLSDIHYGEDVDPRQVFGVNKTNTDIIEQRVKRVADKTIHLLRDVLHKPDFPGVVLILGGDLINGMIHDELMAGADKAMMAQVLGIADVLYGVIVKLIIEFGRVFIVGVPGNHGRITKKPWAKFYAETNVDWLVYQFLERFLIKEVAAGKVTFLCPPARDVTYRVAGRRFRLTHGDQFRGGDGVIGPLGPITRGDKKKRSMATTLPHDGENYETLILGHFHQLYMTGKLIINGSIKGYDEYALSNNFEYEPPQQALFLTHEKYGINHYMPVLADEPADPLKSASWVSWQADKNLSTSQDLIRHLSWATKS